MYIFAYFLVYWIIYEKSIKGLVCWSHLDSYRRVRLKSVLIPVCFFLQDLLKLDFNDTLVSSTRTFPVNIFNLEEGETMLARDKGNFHALGKDQTRDPPVQWLERPIFIVFGGSRVRFSPRVRNVSLSQANMVPPPFKWKMFTGSVCVLLTSVSLKLITIKIELIYATTSSQEKKTKWQVKGKWRRLILFFFLWSKLIFLWSELILVQFYFIFIFLFDPSRSELIQPGLAVRVHPVRLLYLPHKKCVIFFFLLCTFMVILWQFC